MVHLQMGMLWKDGLNKNMAMPCSAEFSPPLRAPWKFPGMALYAIFQEVPQEINLGPHERKVNVNILV